MCAIEKANKAKQALRILSRYFSTDEMLKLALFYSRLYYGAKVWLTMEKKIFQTYSEDWITREDFLNSERNQGFKFTRNNKLKIGFNCFSNRLQKVSQAQKFFF